MRHQGTVRLETPRLILRRFEMDDAQSMFDNWASDDNVTRFLTWPTHHDVDITKKIIQSWIDQYSNPKFYQWVIVLDEIKELIGTISVVHPIDDKIQAAEIGYCIGEKWWNQGITSEALQEVIQFLLDEVQVNCVLARHDTRNPNSGKVMEKCGMKYDGTLRQYDWNNQGICDVSFYSILASEW
jgi:ribosomal-protein-alanine N-acetyltransferase